MEKKEYTPHPIDTRDVSLPPDLLRLAGVLAKNVHEVWAQSRISQGWHYGVKRDDTAKTHPCLIPFEDLPEVEKDYDRDTALETLRLIVKLGYKITGPVE